MLLSLIFIFVINRQIMEFSLSQCEDVGVQTEPVSPSPVREVQKIIEVPIEVPISASPARLMQKPLAVELQLVKVSTEPQPLSTLLDKLLSLMSLGNVEEQMKILVEKLISNQSIAEGLYSAIIKCNVLQNRMEGVRQGETEWDLVQENDGIVEREVRKYSNMLAQQVSAKEEVGVTIDDQAESLQLTTRNETTDNANSLNIPKIVRYPLSQTDRVVKKSSSAQKLEVKNISAQASTRSPGCDDQLSEIQTANISEAHQESLQKCQEQLRARYQQLKLQTQRQTQSIRSALQTTIASLTNQVSTLKSVNRSLQIENTSIKAHLNLQENQLSSAIEELKTSRANTLDLMEQLKTKTYSEAKSGLEDIKEWEGYVEALTSQKEGLKGLIEEAINRTKVLKKRNQLLEQQITGYQEVEKLGEEENRGLREKIHEIQGELEQKENLIGKLRVDKSHLKRSFEEVCADNQQLKMSFVDPYLYEQLLEENQRQREYLVKYEQDIEYMNDIVEKYKDLLARGDRIVGALCQQNCGYGEKQVMDLKYRQVMAKLKSRQTCLIQQSKDLNRLIHQENKQLLRELYELCAKNEGLEERLAILEKENSIVRGKMHKITQSRVQSDLKLSKMEKANLVDQLSDELQDEKEANARLRRQIVKLNKVLKTESRQSEEVDERKGQRNHRFDEQQNPIFGKSSKDSLTDCCRLADQLSFRLNKKFSTGLPQRPRFNQTAPTHSPVPSRQHIYPPYPNLYHTPVQPLQPATPLTFQNFINVFSCTPQWIFTVMLRLTEAVNCRMKQTQNCESLSPKDILVYGWEETGEPDALVIVVREESSAKVGLYAAPETLLGECESEETLIWNLGVIFDEMIHGELYFKTKRDLMDPQKSYRFRDSEQSEEVQLILTSLLSRDPDERPNLSELLSGIREQLNKS